MNSNLGLVLRAMLSLVGLTAMFGCASVRGSGHVVRETRSVHDFDRVEIEGEGELRITQGNEESLVIEAEDNILDELSSKVRDDELLLRQRRNGVWLRPTKPIIYHLVMRDISAITVSGSADVMVEEIESDSLELRISGSGEIDVEQLETKRLRVHIDGSGDISAAGEAERQSVDISGSGTYRAFSLRSEECDVEITGSGDVDVRVEEELDVSITGSGGVRYKGDADVDRHVIGSGDVKSAD